MARRDHKGWAPRTKAPRTSHAGIVTEAEATEAEIKAALHVIGVRAGLLVLRLHGYDRGRNVFSVAGQDLRSRRIVDARIGGEQVGVVVRAARLLNGGRKLELTSYR